MFFLAAGAYASGYTRRGAASPVGDLAARSSTATDIADFRGAAEGREVRIQP
jgi:hypothetical protein